MGKDIWVDTFKNLESPDSPEPSGPAEMAHSSLLNASD